MLINICKGKQRYSNKLSRYISVFTDRNFDIAFDNSHAVMLHLFIGELWYGANKFEIVYFDVQCWQPHLLDFSSLQQYPDIKCLFSFVKLKKVFHLCLLHSLFFLALVKDRKYIILVFISKYLGFVISFVLIYS